MIALAELSASNQDFLTEELKTCIFSPVLNVEHGQSNLSQNPSCHFLTDSCPFNKLGALQIHIYPTNSVHIFCLGNI